MVFLEPGDALVESPPTDEVVKRMMKKSWWHRSSRIPNMLDLIEQTKSVVIGLLRVAPGGVSFIL